MTTRVYVTGRVEIESDGKLITEQQFPSRQGRMLFAYMICHRQHPVTREELADILWPNALPAAWEAALHALVSKLRRLLNGQDDAGSLSLTNSSGTYVLHIGGDVWI